MTCNVNIACETDAAIQTASAAVGVIVISLSNLSSLLGSGSLINVPGTVELEPYVLTANHVLGSPTEVPDTEVFWDFRSTLCDSNNAGSRSACPRSTGDAFLRTNASLDCTLFSVDSVPVGEFGRAYLGWDTRTPVVNDAVLVMHHPGGTHMRISYGVVKSVDNTVSASGDTYYHETRLGWSEGVTEGGSSGSAYLYANTLRLGGTLTSGPQHVCGAGTSVNYDYFSSFRDFYNDLTPTYLTGSTGAEEDEAPQAGEGEGEGEPGFNCFGGSLGSAPPSGPSGGDMAVVLGLVALLGVGQLVLRTGRQRS